MSEILGPGEVENLRMQLGQKLQLLLANIPLSEVVQNFDAQDFCDFEDGSQTKVIQFRIKDFIDHLIKAEQTDKLMFVDTDHLKPIKRKSAEYSDTPPKMSRGDKRREVDLSDWLNAEEIETYLKRFNPKITRRTIKSWIQEMQPLDSNDCQERYRKIQKPSVCYSPRIIRLLEKKIQKQVQRKDWRTEKEIAEALSKEHDLNASPETVSTALKSIRLSKGIDFKQRLDTMDREQTHYSPRVIEMIRQYHKERGQSAPTDWKPLFTLIGLIKAKHPNQLNQNRDYRKMVHNFIQKQISDGTLKADEDYKIALTDKNQPMMHYSPKAIELIEQYLISKN